MGTIETESADHPGRHEFTRQERERGAKRARQARVTERRRFRRWARQDSLLYRQLEDARTFGTEKQVLKAHRAWAEAEHQRSMPIRGRMESG